MDLRNREEVLPGHGLSVQTPSPKTFRCLLGIEGGGTRTLALVASPDGREIARFETGPANLRHVTDQELARRFVEIARQLPEPSAIGIGLAGGWEETDWRRIREASAIAWPNVPCTATNDLEIALSAAALDLPEARNMPSVLVLSGTGSCCYARDVRGTMHKVGGWGSVLGDDGSAFDIASTALRRVARERDRTGLWPALGARILRSLLLNSANDLIDWATRATPKQVAALAPEVTRGNDRLSREILNECALRMAESAASCASKVSLAAHPVRFVFAGGLLLGSGRYADSVERHLRELWPAPVVKKLACTAVWGAIEMARRCCQEPIELSQPLPLADKQPFSKLRSRGLPPTEWRNPASMKLDRMPVPQAVELMLQQDAAVPSALLQELPKIEKVVRLIVASLRGGGRLVYVGAGTSGRLGVLDASECPPTFRTDPELVQGIIAGGQEALWRSIEGAEDDAAAGAEAMESRRLNKRDIVIGIAASGTTRFVWGAISRARAIGARTVLVCFNPLLVVPPAIRPDILLAVNTGPEILTGSTRLKAGTATKLLLNIFTTISMVQLGKVASNLMVDVNPSNTKLRQRAVRIVCELTGVSAENAERCLEHCRWDVKAAAKKARGMARGRESG